VDTPNPNHPTQETLRAYGLGKLDDASAETVHKHLEDCEECRRQVSEMSPDSFLGRLRDAQEEPEKSASSSAAPGASPTGSTVDDAIVDSSSSPCMSSTGEIDATFAALDRPDQTSREAGTRIGYFGDYELLKVLGEGGMGIVYKARQLSLNRPVAVKMIKAARFASVDEVRRFQNESEAVARLDHPNIVPVFEVGQYEDQHYFSMKLIAGESLDKRSKDYLSDPRRAAELLAITAGAIHHAHQRGILHRDLKPANILIDSEGRPHVTDFGLAKRVEGDSELTRSGAILGTPAYMAPEQASGKRGAVTTVTDVYGLGAVLYVVLTGKAPFGGDSVIDTLEQVRERPPIPPTKRNPRVPRDLEVICLKCLEKDPRFRYASADALAEDLTLWLAGKPIVARPVGRGERARLWIRRHPATAALAVTSVVAVAAIAAAGIFIAYSGELKRANNVIEESRRTLQSAYESEAVARKRAEASETDASEQRAIAVSARDEARKALDLASDLLNAMEITQKSSPELQLLLSFPPAQSPEFKEAMAKGQGIAERLAYGVDEATTATVGGAKSRARATPRDWQARYDLVMGRFLATKIRCHEYNWACARMKKAPPKFANLRSNAWKLVPGEVIPAGEKLAAACLKAKALLQRVVDENPGTDYALQALRDLNDPFGFKWVETYVEPVVPETQAATKTTKQLQLHSQMSLLDLAAQLAHQNDWAEAREALGRAGDPKIGTAEAFQQFQQRGDVWAMLGSWGRACADYDEVLRLRVEDPSTRHHQILALLAAGDRDAARQAGSELLNRLSRTTDPWTANSVAWTSVFGRSPISDSAAPVRLAEFALEVYPATVKGAVLNTLGATLYRAGRLEDAIRRLEEGIKLRNRESLPQDWPFLSMAHLRLGHRDEARQWLDRLRTREPNTDPDEFWNELEIRLLCSEAEAVILYDPIFPADPFAH
jgi:tetratricopeptide (TPR) repeat protein/tRNA A-37 threonylcarbamoyl transferase component Bud32